MKHLELSWTWVTESPLHCGSGLSRPGRADRLVARDGQGRPVIPGDAVKGALRMSANQVMSWLDCGEHYEDGETAEPKNRLLSALFGGKHRGKDDAAGGCFVHFGPGVLEDKPPDDDKLLRLPSTAIDEQGVARDDTLRVIEALPPGLCFRCTISAWLEDALVEPACTLLVAALAATEAVGAKAGIGWGRVRINTGIALKLGGKKQDPGKVCSQKRLEALKEKPDQNEGSKEEQKQIKGPQGDQHKDEDKDRGSPTGSSKLDGSWHCLTLRLEEPTCVGKKPWVSNKVETTRHIPATTLRGAIFAMWRRKGVCKELTEAALGKQSRWSPAFPVFANDEPMVPVPRSFAAVKREPDLGDSPHGLHDALAGRLPPEEEEVGGKKQKIQWRGLRKGWMTAEARPRSIEQRSQVAMHVARDYETGSKREGALYARESLLPGWKGEGSSNGDTEQAQEAAFVAYAYLPKVTRTDGTAESLPLDGDIFLGKRTSAGSGRATLSVKARGDCSEIVGASERGTSTSGKELSEKHQDDVFVQLLSPALVRGTHGHWLRSLTVDEWVRLLQETKADGNKEEKLVGGDHILRPNGRPDLDEDGKPKRAGGSEVRSGIEELSNWMGPWGHGRARVTAIASGSVWRLRCKDKTTADGVRSRLKRLAKAGLGERTHEGFGWLVVDPPWLGVHVGRKQNKAPTDDSAGLPDPTKPVRRWPGCDKLKLDELKTLLDKVPQEIPAKLSRPFHELARMARAHGATVVRVFEFMDGRATRKHPGRWEDLKPNDKRSPAREYLDQVTEGWSNPLEALRFALEALLIRCEEVEQ